ncbi:disease resistance protein Roq1 [Lactuca sativa]|uniref:TIR domain-containing protein n=1 Tax=Lactuca sativa TaxID=4236 RepID=A0A9R1UMJ2_LACSA|nr:disease resistance protein Roq1 [Lactuca sativa]KAJ0190003.1 hypothetical protein LSAT_V11C800409080 [Lactuca sativa]
MASSSSSPSGPAFSSAAKSWKYDVFLSFRGEDTRKTFVDHLYSALEEQGIYSYKDDITLARGESISPSLLQAIEESQIAIIVFSKNYANSTWCLDELTHIIKCRNEIGQTVMPIFYDVDPSEVRKQKRKYKEAFDTHEVENKNRIKSWGQAFVDDPWGWLSAPLEQNRKYREAAAKQELEHKTRVESWRKALVEASNISGWETTQIANGHESQGIKQIVVEISQKLYPLTSKADENLIGMAVRGQSLKSELQIESGGVLMIGIWGVGGGGKTTLASSVYREISSKFNGCCFIKNIREESSRYGLEKLQKKILSEMKVSKVGGGRSLIDNRLRRRKVLIVLDDVDHLDQLKALAGSHDWFGEGSRIIITTRDVHLLNAHRVDVMHNISLLNNDEAMKLFCKLSPQGNRPKEDYERLSKEVVSYVGGLPLALSVLGPFLCDKDIDEWKSALARLKDIPNDDIVGKLKLSFDGLTKVEKELFLDIACFFRWENKEKSMEILDACGFHPVIGVKVLIQKALITISKDGEFDMHDLVQEMGHHIVRGEHPNNPEKHTRVWKEEDAITICSMDATTELDMIEAVGLRFFVFPLEDKLPLVANGKNLRWIQWQCDIAIHLLSNFPQRTLCCLILGRGLQKQLWEGNKFLPNLKIIELWSFHNLIVTPDFCGLPNLERFILTRCFYLEEIHPSIGRLERLVFLRIAHCPRLEMFPPITQPKKLKTLEFSSCPKLFNISEIQKQNIDNLGNLDLDNSGKEVESSMECCLEEPCLPRNNMKPCLHDNLNHIGLQFFFKDIRKLDLSFCSLGDEEIFSADWELPNLEELNLRGNDFSLLSFSRLKVPRLKLLNVSYCQGLVELSELPSSIAVILADSCTSLETCGDVSNCKWLWNVSLLFGNSCGGDILLHSMLQGNAIQDHFIIVILESQIPKEFESRLFRRNTFTLHFPDDWYSDFCGFLICVVTEHISPKINILIKQGVINYYPFWLMSNEVEPESDGMRTFVGYVSFGSLRHTAFSNSSYTVISVYTNIDSYVVAKLVPRKSKAQVQTTKFATDFSEFYEQELNYGEPSFTIQDGPNSSINIIWQTPQSSRA